MNEMNPHKEPGTGSGNTKIPLQFKGKGAEFFEIWIVNVLLSILTLGIYSAWAKVRTKQYFYGNTYIGDASFRYTANPVNILKGRLIAIGFLFLFSMTANVSPLLYAILSFAFIFLLPWVIIKSLKFNGRYTQIRNINFGFIGTYGEAFVRFILLTIATVFTLGFFYPYQLFMQKEYIINNYKYGTSKFKFKAGAGPFYKMFGVIALITIAAGVLFFYTMGPAFKEFIEMSQMGRQPDPGKLFWLQLKVMAFVMPIYFFVFVYMQTMLYNIIFNNVELEGHKIKANLKLSEMFGIYFTNILLVIATLGFGMPYAIVRVANYKVNNTHIEPAGDLDSFVADEQQKVSSLGEEVGEAFDFDIGF